MMAKQTNGILICALGLMLSAGCASSEENKNATATTTVSPPIVKEMTVVPRPQTIEDLMKQRGEQDQAKPALHVIAPANNSTIKSSTVEVKLHLDGAQ